MLHTDMHDVTDQIIVTLGQFTGGVIRVYESTDVAAVKEGLRLGTCYRDNGDGGMKRRKTEGGGCGGGDGDGEGGYCVSGDDIGNGAGGGGGGAGGGIFQAEERAEENVEKGTEEGIAYRDIDAHRRPSRFDGRRVHHVLPFNGVRYSVIYYKSFDRTKGLPDPLLPWEQTGPAERTNEVEEVMEVSGVLGVLDVAGGYAVAKRTKEKKAKKRKKRKREEKKKEEKRKKEEKKKRKGKSEKRQTKHERKGAVDEGKKDVGKENKEDEIDGIFAAINVIAVKKKKATKV